MTVSVLVREICSFTAYVQGLVDDCIYKSLKKAEDKTMQVLMVYKKGQEISVKGNSDLFSHFRILKRQVFSRNATT